MYRRFRTHDRRVVDDLRGVWDFRFLGDVEPGEVNVADLSFNDGMAVPGCFDATPSYAGRRGLAAYRTRLLLRDDTAHRLVLDGVHHWCRIYINGTAIRSHSGGFVRFTADVPRLAAGEAELVVLVDNRFDPIRCPTHLDYFDWYHYGGIARGAELHRLGRAWIDAVRIVTLDEETRRLHVVVDYGCDGTPVSLPFSIRFDGQEVLSETLDITKAPGRIGRIFEAEGAELWSPRSPHLHEIHIGLGEDDRRERVGIRRVTVDGGRILVNGEAQTLVGFNRHESHPQFGHALPDALLLADVQQLADLGCNFLRGSHYPQDERFLDLCDEAGICVWNEAIGWQHGPDQLTDGAFLAAQVTNIDEMVCAAANHASVIMWGVLNESHSHDPACRPAYEKLLGRLRKSDDTRPVTYACNHPMDDVCLDLADVIAVNCYPGWYAGEIEDIPEHLDRIAARMVEAGQGHKPLVISEIGAGAIYGCRDAHEGRWSEQYQRRLLEKVIGTMFRERNCWCGLAIWQFCDVRTGEKMVRGLGRPRGFNNKGIVDEYRRPKLAYEAVRTLFRELTNPRVE